MQSLSSYPFTGISAVLAAFLLTACAGGARPLASPDNRITPEAAVTSTAARPRYTCCNIFYEPPSPTTSGRVAINDGNYRYSLLLPAGTPVAVKDIGRYQIVFSARDLEFDLRQRFGFDEPFASYIDKILPFTDPSQTLAAQPPEISALIREGKIALGMTKAQVLLAIGHPPLHQTPSLDWPRWRYWFGRFDRFDLEFDEAGRVSGIRTDPNVNMTRLWSGPRTR